MQHTQRNDYNHVKLLAVIGIATASLVFSVMTFFMVMTMGSQVRNSVESVEIMRAGGPENYAKVQMLYNSAEYKQQQQQAINSALQRVNPNAAGTQTAPDTSAAQANAGTPMTLSAEQMDKIFDKALTYGEKNAEVAVIEYSDFECPFCQRHHNAHTLKTLVDNSNGNVKKVFKQYPLPFHASAQKAAE